MEGARGESRRREGVIIGGKLEEEIVERTYFFNGIRLGFRLGYGY